jgi:hypothetical protein
MPISDHERRQALGKWGEKKALVLLENAGFKDVRDVNAETHNHPFGDIYAKRRSGFVIGVKTRNRFQKRGVLNDSFNVQKKGFDIQSIGKQYDAVLAWVAIQVIPELQSFNAYFGTIKQIQERKERFSIPLKPDEIRDHGYERLGAADELDLSIRPEWSNGGYPAHLVLKGNKKPTEYIGEFVWNFGVIESYINEIFVELFDLERVAAMFIGLIETGKKLDLIKVGFEEQGNPDKALLDELKNELHEKRHRTFVFS